MHFIHIVLAGILVLGPLIAIHEFGHFWMARRFNVKVLTFSIGFGPSVWSRMGRDGTEYRLAAIPLGGYVRMLDESEGDVPEALRHRAFNVQPVAVRMAIVAAGPLINLALAVVLYWALFMQSGESLRPIVARVLPNSAVATAGLKPGAELLEIDGKPVDDWESANYALIGRLGETGQLSLKVMPSGSEDPQTLSVSINRYLAGTSQDPFRALGMVPWTPALPAVIGEVQAGSAADKSGLAVDDTILDINDKPVGQWSEVVEQILLSPEQAMTWRLLRDGKPWVLTVTPDADHEITGERYGHLGIAVKEAPVVIPAEYKRERRLNPLDAFLSAVHKTWQIMGLSLQSMGKMLTGLVGVDNLSGPITIVKVAGQSASIGWEAFIGFMALLSVSLGVLNLLPIPILDGGHLLYYAVEAIWRRPLPNAVQMLGLRVGVALMGSVMLLAIFNDIRRLF